MGDEMQKIDMKECFWINEPKDYILKSHQLILATEPHTDLWSKTYYGKIENTAPILCFDYYTEESITVCCQYKFKKKYDQCGMVVYITDDCWFKICVGYRDNEFSRLSTVVTMNGYSDWSSMNIGSDISLMFFRLSKQGYDFKIENSFDGKHFKQMRVFHLDPLGKPLRVGLYACSPLDSSFDATFSHFIKEAGCWQKHKGERK